MALAPLYLSLSHVGRATGRLAYVDLSAVATGVKRASNKNQATSSQRWGSSLEFLPYPHFLHASVLFCLLGYILQPELLPALFNWLEQVILKLGRLLRALMTA